MAKSVTDYLNEVDYEKLKGYKPTQATLEFINFMHMCEDGKVENKTPVVHLVAIDSLELKALSKATKWTTGVLFSTFPSSHICIKFINSKVA